MSWVAETGKTNPRAKLVLGKLAEPHKTVEYQIQPVSGRSLKTR